MSKQQWFIVFFALATILETLDASSLPPHVLARRDDFNNLVSELRSKGSRMRFGKRTAPIKKESYFQPYNFADLFLESDPLSQTMLVKNS